MLLRRELLISASVLALGFETIATLPSAFAQQTTPAPAAEPQQIPAVNVPRPEQKKRAAVKKAAPKTTAKRVPTETAAAPSIMLPEIQNIAAATRQTDPDSSASEMTVSGAAHHRAALRAAGRISRSDARPDRHPAFRRGQSQPVLPARLQSRPRHRPRHQRRRHAGEHAHPRPRPGLCRHQLPDPGTDPVDARPQGPLLRRRRRLLVGRRAAHRLHRHA